MKFFLTPGVCPNNSFDVHYQKDGVGVHTKIDLNQGKGAELEQDI